MLVRITIHAARKRFAEGNPVYLCPCKLRPDGPWSSAALIHPKEYVEKAQMYRDHPTLWKGTINLTAWDLMVSNWKWANSLCNETGHYPHFYVEV